MNNGRPTMTVTEAETTNLTAAKTFLADMGDHLRQLLGRIDTARAALAARDLDTDTLDRIDRVRAQTAALAASAAAGVQHLTDYHRQMEQAVNTTPEAADTDFYRSGAAPPAGQCIRHDPASPGKVAGMSVPDEIRQAYAQLAARAGDYVPLTAIRDTVPTKDRDQVDQALRQLMDDPAVRLEPEPFGFRIGPKEKQAAIHIGGEDRHQLAIGVPGGDRGVTQACVPEVQQVPDGSRQVEPDAPAAHTAAEMPGRRATGSPSHHDPVAAARHVADLVRENNHADAAFYLEGLGRDGLRAVAEAAGVPEARTPQVKTNHLVEGVLQRAHLLSRAGAPAPARRVTSPRGTTYEFDPSTGATAVIEPDGWRAVVPASSSTGLAARLLYWRAEIQDGRGDDATVPAARALLDRLSVAELHEVAADVGAVSRGARTKAQLIDVTVTMAISSARNARALRQL